MNIARRRGLALVLIAGLLVLLAVAATALVSLASGARAAAGVRTDLTTARLLARSGMVYAEARLRENPTPARAQTRDTQPDDWTFRDDPALPLEKARNPSYAQTEPYTDVLNDGAFNGTDPFTDANGNGRFDAWSGRLRGRLGPNGAVFRLKIEGAGGKLCVNDGFLDTRAGALGDPVMGVFNAATRSRYLGNLGLLLAHQRLADMIGEIEIVTGGNPATLNGNRIIQRRPIGGYGSLAAMRTAVGADIWERIGPYLTFSSSGRSTFGNLNLASQKVGSYYPSVGSGNWYGSVLPVFDWSVSRTPLELGQTSVLMLQALVQDAGGNSSPTQIPVPALQALIQDTGVGIPVTGPAQSISETEARAFATALAARRPLASWQEFFEWLNDAKATVFSGTPDQIEYKVNETEVALNADPFEEQIWMYSYWNGPQPRLPIATTTSLQIPFFAWRSYDLDRLSAPRINGDRRKARFHSIYGFRNWSSVWGTYELGLGTGGSFQVESLGTVPGTVARVEMALEMVQRVRARSQDDFENLDGDRSFGSGIRLQGRPLRDRTQTYPLFSMDSCPDYVSKPLLRRYPNMTGSIWLMDRSAGPRGGTEVFYLPCWEKGQPLRQPDDPGNARENFEDASDLKAFPSYHPQPPFATIKSKTHMNQGNGGDQAEIEFSGSCGADLVFTWGPVDPGEPPGNPGKFPMPPAKSGTIEWEHLNAQSFVLITNPLLFICPTVAFTQDSTLTQILWIQADAHTNASQVNQVGYAGKSEILSVQILQVPAAHAIAFTFGDGSQIRGYIDGIPDPGLIWPDYEGEATDYTYGQKLTVSNLDEARLDTKEQSPQAVLARGAQPRYWLPDDGRAGFPSFLSARYQFESPVAITDAHWEGYVPRLIRDAALNEAFGGALPPGSEPLRVELLLYDGLDDPVSAFTVPLAPGGWRIGGGTEDVGEWLRQRLGGRIPRFRAFQYRVWMDASAVTGLSNETPVFDSISVGLRGASRMSGWSEE